MRLRHVVLIRVADGAPTDAIVAGIRGLAAVVPEIESLDVHANLRATPSAYDLLITVEVADADALQRYLRHPAHVRITDELLMPATRGIAVLQHEVP